MLWFISNIWSNIGIKYDYIICWEFSSPLSFVTVYCRQSILPYVFDTGLGPVTCFRLWNVDRKESLSVLSQGIKVVTCFPLFSLPLLPSALRKALSSHWSHSRNTWNMPELNSQSEGKPPSPPEGHEYGISDWGIAFYTSALHCRRKLNDALSN